MDERSGSESDSLSYEMIRLEDVITEAMLEHYGPVVADKAFRRLHIGCITGVSLVTLEDRIAITKALFKYHSYLVFELRTPAPEVLPTSPAQLLIHCDNWLTLRITFKE